MSVAFKIEKGVAMPERKRGRPTRYPWAQMEIGDSFVAPYKPNLVLAAARYQKKFSYRKQSDGTVRVWRVA